MKTVEIFAKIIIHEKVELCPLLYNLLRFIKLKNYSNSPPVSKIPSTLPLYLLNCVFQPYIRRLRMIHSGNRINNKNNANSVTLTPYFADKLYTTHLNELTFHQTSTRLHLRGLPNVPDEPAITSDLLRCRVDSSLNSSPATIWAISRSFFISGGLNCRLASEP